MIEQTIIYGSIFVFMLETIINLKQYFKLRKAKQTKTTKMILPDDKEFKKMKDYNTEKMNLIFISEFLGIIKLVLLVKYNFLYNVYDKIARTFPNTNVFTIQVYFILVYIVVGKILSMPGELISTFYIEQKYGFNKMTAMLYIQDFIKSLLLAGVIVSGILYLMLYLINIFPESFYLQVFVSITIVQLALMVLFPILIQPLFNKFVELKEGDLKTNIIKLAKEVGFKPSKILTMDGSTRSHHSNAYFIGLFKEKRIVLYDTLLKQANDDEILAILCHEFGHWHFNHIVKGMVIRLLIMFFYIYSFNYFVRQKTSVSYYPMVLKLLYYCLLTGFTGPLLNLFTNSLTRKYEREADVYAVKKGYGEELKSGLVKLHVENKSNLFPDEWYSAYNHSHPTLYERLELISNEMRKIE